MTRPTETEIINTLERLTAAVCDNSGHGPAEAGDSLDCPICLAISNSVNVLSRYRPSTALPTKADP